MIESAMVFWVPVVALAGLGLGLVGIVGAVYNTRLRIKHGYPLQSMWGAPMHPKKPAADDTVALLTSQNAQLREELANVKDRLATLERIVTDDGHRLTSEIEALRGPVN